MPDTNELFFQNYCCQYKQKFDFKDWGIVCTTYTRILDNLKQSVAQYRPLYRRLGAAPLKTLLRSRLLKQTDVIDINMLNRWLLYVSQMAFNCLKNGFWQLTKNSS